nr:kelch-like erythroid cell-derived protein-1 [Tigriopus japonicus]
MFVFSTNNVKIAVQSTSSRTISNEFHTWYFYPCIGMGVVALSTL